MITNSMALGALFKETYLFNYTMFINELAIYN